MEDTESAQLVKSGAYKDTEYRIMLREIHITDKNGTLFSHTRWYTAYIKVPSMTKARRLPVHGGVTFSETITNKSDPNPEEFTKGKWVGWDYAHATDLTILKTPTGTDFRQFGLHEWSEEEVFEELKQAIDNLKSRASEISLEGLQEQEP